MEKTIQYRLKRISGCLICACWFAAKVQAQLGASPILLAQPLDTSVQNGDTAVVAATIAPSLTPQKFYWFFNGQPVVTNADITVSNTTSPSLDIISALVIHGATATNGGIYSLRITNGVGSAISSNAILTVMTVAITNGIRFVSSGIGLGASGFQIQLSGPAGSNYVIQASTDLKNWVSIATNPAPAGSVSFTDHSAIASPIRFYRAFVQ